MGSYICLLLIQLL